MSTDLPKMRFTGSGSRVFAAAVTIFVSTTCLAYLLIDASGLNIPLYYPALHAFSTAPVQDQISISLYGGVAAAATTGVLVTALFLLLSPLFHALHLLRTNHMTVMATTVIWAVIALMVVQTWSHWGIAERGLNTSDINNAELGLFAVGLVIFFGGIVLTAAAVRRMAVLNPPVSRRDDQSSDADRPRPTVR